MQDISKKVAVIGGGISGLTTAFLLKKNGIDVKLFEKSERVGGTIRTEIENGFLVEYGPNSTLETTPLIDELLTGLGILDEKIEASKESNKRYILREGKILPLPMKPMAFLGTKLFSGSAKLRLFKEPFIRSKSNEYETIGEFTRRRLGQEFLDYAINPFVAGVFAGDPKHINVKTAFPKLYELEENYGSLLTGAIRSARKRRKSKEKSKQSAKTISFKRGMQTIVNALNSNLSDNIFLNQSVEKVTMEGKGFSVMVNQYDKTKNESFDAVIVSTPSSSASELIQGFDERLSEKLKEVYYPPVNVVFTGFRESDVGFRLDGFGYLIPEKEKRRILGSLWSSSLFKGRAPENHCALTSFVGGARSPELTRMNDGELISTTVEELDYVLGIKSQPVYTKIIRWEHAIPQYNNHYSDLTHSLMNFMKNNSGFFFCSNFLGGISVSDCIKNSYSTVSNVLEYLKK